MVKYSDGNVPTHEESLLRRWKHYCEKLMNETNKRKRRMEDVKTLKQYGFIPKKRTTNAIFALRMLMDSWMW